MPKTVENAPDKQPSPPTPIIKEGDDSKTESGEEWLEGIFETFSLSDECGQTLFEQLENSACDLADRLMGCRTNKTRSLYQGLARQYVNFAKGYANAFEVLNNDPVISWFVENGTFGLDKIELLRKKEEKLCETIKILEQTLKNPNQAGIEKVERGANLRKSRRKQLRKDAKGILEEAAKVAEQRARQKPSARYIVNTLIARYVCTEFRTVETF